MHGVALATAKLHAAPRAVVVGREPAHGAVLSSRGRYRWTRRRGEVRRNLPRHPVQHRLVQVRGERSRSLLRRHRAARRSLPTLGPALLLQDRAHTLSLLHLVLAIIVGSLRLGVIVLERIQTSSGDLRARWGLRGEKSAWIGGRAASASGRGVRRVVGSHLSSRVLVHALERLGDCLDAGRLSLYHLESLARLGVRWLGVGG